MTELSPQERKQHEKVLHTLHIKPSTHRVEEH